MKIGLVGTGAWGKTLARKFVEQGHVIECHSRGKAGAAEGMGELVDWKTMQGRVDVIVAAAPPPVVEDVAFFCIERGIPALVTKPLMGGEDMLSKWNNSLFFVDYVHLHSPFFQKLKGYVEAKKLTGIGIENIDTQFYSDGPVRGFLALFDYGPHPLSMIFALANTCSFEVEKAKRRSSRPGKEFYDVDAQVAHIKVHMAVGNDVVDKIAKTRVHVRFSDDSWAAYEENWPEASFEASEYTQETTNAHDPLGLLVMKVCTEVSAEILGEETDLELSSDVEYALSTIREAAASSR